MKKLSILLIALVSSVGLLLAEHVQIGDFYYYLGEWEGQRYAMVTYEEYGSTNNYENIIVANIPDSVQYNGNIYPVIEVGYSAFEDCFSLTSVTIPNSVTHINNEAFKNCQYLTSVTIGSGITYIGGEAFDDCYNLTEVTIEAMTPPTLESNYSNEVFDWRVQSFYVPCGSIDAYKAAPYWYNYYYDEIKYKNSLYNISTIKTNGGNISVPENLTICDEYVNLDAVPDRGCYFVRWADGNTDNPRTIELTQDTTMEAIFDYLLSGKCGKDSALTWTLDTTTMALTIIGKGALSENYTYGKFIKSLTIGDEVTIIGQNAFSGSNSLKNVILGSSVKVLENSAFFGCSAVETITCFSQRPPTVNDYALYGLDYNTIVYVPTDYLNTYKMHDAWGLYDVRPIEGSAEGEIVQITINYQDRIGVALNNETVTFHFPEAPEVEGFTFLGWQPVAEIIDNKIAIQAVYEPEDSSYSPASISVPGSPTQKLLREGNVYILHNGKTYTIQGQEVK